jgi:hypothetical protein
MIFASIFGSFVAIAVLQRLWPRKVEVIHRTSSNKDEYMDKPEGPYRSV